MESAEIAEVKVVAMEEKVADAEQELSEAKIRAAKAAREFSEEKKRMDGLSKNIIHLVVKLEEVGNHLTSMHQKLETACMGKAQMIANTETKIAELEKITRLRLKN